MGNVTEIGAIRARFLLDTQNYRAGMERVKADLKEVDRGADKTKTSIKAVEVALVSLGASHALVSMVRMIGAVVTETTKLSNAMTGMSSVATAFGEDIGEVTTAAQKLAEDGLAPVATYASSLKSLLSTGIGLDKAVEMITTFKDRAAFGKAETISFAQAVENLSSAFKTESSELGDLSGMTENFSQILEVGAQSMGKNVDQLSSLERANAKYLGIVQLSQPFVGDSIKMTEEFSGKQAMLNAKWTEAKQTLGESYLPVLEEIMNKVTPIVIGIAGFIDKNKSLVVGLTAGAVTMTALTAAGSALIAVIAALRIAMVQLQISAGPVGWAFLAIGAAGATAYGLAANSASESTFKFADSIEELNAKLAQSPLKRSVEDVKALQSGIETLNGLIEKRKQLESDLSGATSKLTLDVTSRLISDVDDKLSVFGVNTPEEAPKVIADLNRQLQESIPALLQVKKEELAGIAAKVAHVDQVEKLRDKYDELSKVEKLSATQKAELATVVQALKKEYPSLLAVYDEEGKWHVENTGLLNDKIDAEKDFVDTSAKGMKTYLQNLQTTTKAQKGELTTQIEQLKKLAEAYSATNLPEFTKLSPAATNAVSTLPGMVNEKALQTKIDELNRVNMSSNDIDKAIADITSGNWKEFEKKVPDFGGGRGTPPPKKNTGKTAAEIAQDMRKQAFDNAMATVRFESQMRNWSADEQIKAYEKVESKHAAHLKATVEDERAVKIEIKHLQDDITADKIKHDVDARQKQFDTSSEFIEKEIRRLREKGATEETIAQFTLTSWTRVRNRYEEDSDFYKRADTEMYGARMTLIDSAKKKDEEAAESRKRNIADLNDKTLDAIRESERSELDSIDKRKQASDDYYDGQLRLLDDQERSAERSDIAAEAEKYRLSASKEGQEKYAELQKQLRKLDTDDARRKLQDTKEAKSRALEDEKLKVQAYYRDLENAFQESADSISSIEKLMQDDRLTLLKGTNVDMLTELRTYIAEYNRIMATKSGSSNMSSVYGPPIPTSESNQQRYLESLVSSGNSGLKKWAEDQLKQSKFHTGGIVGQGNFRIGDKLMPDEISAILKRGETVFTDGQLSSLISAARDRDGDKGGVVHNYHAPFIEHNGDVKLEDKADVKVYWSERDRVVQRLLAEGERDF